MLQLQCPQLQQLSRGHEQMNNMAVSTTNNLSAQQVDKLSYNHIVNGKMVLEVPNNSGLTTQQVQQAQRVINQFNLQANKNNVIVEMGTSPRVSTSNPLFGTILARRQYRYYCANGYEYRDKRGGWHYVVTKPPLFFEAAYGVVLHGWEGALGGGWK
ncbi:hypothetical protein Q757_03895 [Oenococcus alcoholitolerans]|uniref:Uncharacterized protein n=2 Tax=Oenococcus alcoholitolerans TaxID=931074 RepID=A0ABR4XRQ7_9LACO|nr:hypothetical protein Q757_03895 [Oenococcus alcoholitolerans]